MILDSSTIKHAALRRFWESKGANTKGLQPGQVKRLKQIMVHLNTAQSLHDIAQGVGEQRHHHKLKKYKTRYAMEVSGNYRITYDVDDPSTGGVTIIDLEDYH